jgi:hypothetical protein
MGIRDETESSVLQYFGESLYQPAGDQPMVVAADGWTHPEVPGSNLAG